VIILFTYFNENYKKTVNKKRVKIEFLKRLLEFNYLINAF